jgi:hypothetical protein
VWSKNKVPETSCNRSIGSAFARRLVFVIVLALLESACSASEDEPEIPRLSAEGEQALALGEGQIEVPPPPFSPGIYPCSNCHGMLQANPTRRELSFHTDIVLKHDEENRWCLDCHDAENRDVLHLASGAAVGFEESYRLCGQCHGEKYRDWRAGVHGRRSGDWNGHKSYLLCAHCHSPHQPRFQPIVPEPAPIPPKQTVGGLER